MARAQSLKQVLSVLEEAAQQLEDLFQPALCMWLQVDAAVQPHKRSEHAEAAAKAVQAADCACKMCKIKQQSLACMKEHVQHVRGPMWDHAVTQVEHGIKRLDVVRQLLAKRGESRDEKLSAMLQAEAELGWQAHALLCIVQVVAPMATLVKAMSDGQQLARSSAAHDGNRHHQQGAKQGSMAQSIQQATSLCDHLSEAVELDALELKLLDGNICEALTKTGIPCKKEVACLGEPLDHLQLQANMIWLAVVLRLGSNDAGPDSLMRACLSAVDWLELCAVASNQGVMARQYKEVQMLLEGVISRPGLKQMVSKYGYLDQLLDLYGLSSTK